MEIYVYVVNALVCAAFAWYANKQRKEGNMLSATLTKVIAKANRYKEAMGGAQAQATALKAELEAVKKQCDSLRVLAKQQILAREELGSGMPFAPTEPCDLDGTGFAATRAEFQRTRALDEYVKPDPVRRPPAHISLDPTVTPQRRFLPQRV